MGALSFLASTVRFPRTMEQALLTYGPLGIGCFAMGMTIRWMAMAWKADMAALTARFDAALKLKDDELAKERESHQRTRDAHTADLRTSVNMADSLDRMRAEITRLSSSERSAA